MDFFEKDIKSNIKTNIKDIEYNFINKQQNKMIVKISDYDLKYFEKNIDMNFHLNFDGVEILELDYINEKGVAMRKFAKSKGSLYYKYIDYLTEDEIEVKNIKEKNKEEILKNFYTIIDTMNIDTSFKNILKNFFDIDNIIEKTPYLYYNEKEKKNYWYLPDYYNGSVFLEYEKEIPFFVNGGDFLNDFFNTVEKEYIILSKEGMKSVVTKTNKEYTYINNELPTNFVYYPNKHSLDKKSTLFYFTKNEKLSMPCFNFRVLNEEKTQQILEKTKSEKTLENIKNNLNIYINDYKENNIENNSKIENNPFISEFYDYNGQETKQKYFLSNLFINGQEIIIDEIECKEIELYKNNIYSINLKYQYSPNTNFNKELNFFNKALIPDDKITKINKYRNLINQDNYSVDNYLIINKKDNVYNTKIVVFEEKVEINTKSENKLKKINNNSINQNNFIFHNTKNDLFVINLLTNKFKFLDNVNSKDFNELNDEFKSLINLEDINKKNFTDILMLKTNKKLFTIIKQDIEYFLNKSDDYNFEIKEDNKDIDGNYKITTKLLISKEKNTIFSTNFLYKKYKVENNVLDFELNEEEKNKLYYKIEIEYILKDGFYEVFLKDLNKTKELDKSLDFLNILKKNISKNTDFLKEHLIDFKINGVSLDKEEVLDFFNILEVKYINKNTKNFIYKENKNNIFLEIQNISEDNNFYLMKNKKTRISMTCFGDNNFENNNDFYKEFINSKIIGKRYNKYIDKTILNSKEKIYFFSKNKSFCSNFNNEKTLNMKDTIFNNEKSIVFYSDKKISVNLNKDKDIISFKNATEEEKINKLIKSMDISL